MNNYTDPAKSTKIKLSALSGSAGREVTQETAQKNGRCLAVGRYASDDDLASGMNNNDLVIGCSGSGKTGGYVIPNIRRGHGSMVITDTKGQLYHRLRKELSDAGYKVYLLDFIRPEHSMGYNPLDYIRKKPEKAQKGQDGRSSSAYCTRDIVSLAHILCPVRQDDQDPFWQQSAQTVITFLIAFILEALVPEEQDMISVLNLFRQLCVPSGRAAIEQWCADNPDSFAAKKYGTFCGVYEADRTWACIQQYASEALQIFDYEEIIPMFTNKDGSKLLDLHMIGREKTAVFLNISDTDRYADRLVNLFYAQAMQVLCEDADHIRPMGRLRIPVRFILDDFAANAYIENFDKLISVIRSRNISVSVILQNMTQLYSMYSEAEASTILNNCDHILYLGGQDIQTAEYIGIRSNKTAENILLMPRDKAYLLEKGRRGELVDKIRPYTDDNRKERGGL